MKVLPQAAALALASHAADFPASDQAAKPDGKIVNTAAIQAAMDAAAKAKGTVVFEPGVDLTGALFLQSGVELRVDKGVELRGVRDLSAYPVMQTRVAGIEMKWPAALINVYEQTGVKVTGKGSIDGDGSVWWDKYWKMRREEYEPKGLTLGRRLRLPTAAPDSGVQVERREGRGPHAEACRFLDTPHLLLAQRRRGRPDDSQQHRRAWPFD
jgi:polygalacturonase